MPTSVPPHGLQLTSTVTPEGELKLQLAESPVPDPGPEQVVLQVEASPINPSDLILLLGPADPSAGRFEGTPDRPLATFPLAPAARGALARRGGLPLLLSLLMLSQPPWNAPVPFPVKPLPERPARVLCTAARGS